jgi:hypothetical protein
MDERVREQSRLSSKERKSSLTNLQAASSVQESVEYNDKTTLIEGHSGGTDSNF